jgi:hypothetical protein
MEPDEPAIKATEFLDFQVVNARLETLGEIEDLMIGLDSGRVNYAVLSFGGFLDIGDKFFAVPLSAFALNPQRAALMFDVDRETLENAPGFELDDWPDTTNPRWGCRFQYLLGETVRYRGPVAVDHHQHDCPGGC